MCRLSLYNAHIMQEIEAHKAMLGPQAPAHPGEILRGYLPAGVTLNDVADRLGVTRQALSAVVNRRAGISAAMALRIEAAFGTPAEMWCGMQSTYDLWLARRRPSAARRVMPDDAGLRSKRTTVGVVPPAIATNEAAIALVCERHCVQELGLFGSILRADFDPIASDVDATVRFGVPVGESAAGQYFNLKEDLERMFARAVDLVELDAMPDTRLKRVIQGSKLVIYAAAI